MPTIHIALPEDIQAKLTPFAKNRKMSKTRVIQYALEKLFEEEEISPEGLGAFKLVLERKFLIPRGIGVRAFLTFLYLLKYKYPSQSSKAFWGDLVYLSSIDKTHKEILTEIIEEQNQLLGKAKSI